MSRALIISLVVLLAAVVGLGLYTLHLKRAAERDAARATQVAATPLDAPVSGAQEKAKLYIANDQAGTVDAREISTALPANPQQRARTLLRMVVAEYLKPDAPHKLGEGADVTDVFLVKDTAVVNVTAEFADKHPSGVLVEELTLKSLGDTLAANIKGVSHLKLLVAGKERETLAGHADLTNLYDVLNGAELIK